MTNGNRETRHLRVTDLGRPADDAIIAIHVYPPRDRELAKELDAARATIIEQALTIEALRDEVAILRDRQPITVRRGPEPPAWCLPLLGALAIVAERATPHLRALALALDGVYAPGRPGVGQ